MEELRKIIRELEYDYAAVNIGEAIFTAAAIVLFIFILTDKQ